MKILIAGAGISGLSAALCLARRGHQIEVFERAAEISEVGAGLQISPNGMHVLNQLGLGEEIKARGFEPRGIELRLGQTGGVIFDIPLARRSVSCWGAPYIHIHRADLIDCLLKAAKATDNIEICTGWTATSIEQSETGVVLSNELGDRVEGDLAGDRGGGSRIGGGAAGGGEAQHGEAQEQRGGLAAQGEGGEGNGAVHGKLL